MNIGEADASTWKKFATCYCAQSCTVMFGFFLLSPQNFAVDDDTSSTTASGQTLSLLQFQVVKLCQHKAHLSPNMIRGPLIYLATMVFLIRKCSSAFLVGVPSKRTVRNFSSVPLSSSLVGAFAQHPDVIDGPPSYDPSRPYFPMYYNDVYEVNLPINHRFPMEKYRRVRELVQQSVRDDDEGLVPEFYVSPLVTWEELITTHSPEYVERFLKGDQTEFEIRNVGFPWSPSGVKRALSSTGGTVAAACAVCSALPQQGDFPVWAAHIAGGTHHAFYDRGEGFCVFSDIAVAANVVRERFPSLIKRVLIIDLDVHQGNGNAVLFDGRNDVVTFSIQCEANYFSPKEKSDLDIELPVGCTDETYIVTLRHWLKQIEKQGGEFDLVFYQAGVDVLEHDRLGRMNLTQEGVTRRDKAVFDFCTRNELPLVISMGGGYPRNNEWDPILQAHASVYLEAEKYLNRLSQVETSSAGNPW
jgi:acetoin utilization deacetylase AcuC-like enzyme